MWGKIVQVPTFLVASSMLHQLGLVGNINKRRRPIGRLIVVIMEMYLQVALVSLSFIFPYSFCIVIDQLREVAFLSLNYTLRPPERGGEEVRVWAQEHSLRDTWIAINNMESCPSFPHSVGDPTQFSIDQSTSRSPNSHNVESLADTVQVLSTNGITRRRAKCWYIYLKSCYMKSWALT